jgi:hypothetical protein
MKLQGDVTLGEGDQTRQLRNLMARCVLKVPVCSLEQGASLDVFVYLDLQTPEARRKDAVDTALEKSPLWLDWVPGLTTAIVMDISGTVPCRRTPAKADYNDTDLIVSRANLPSPAVSKLFEYDPRLSAELSGQLLAIDCDMQLLWQKSVFTFAHRDWNVRKRGTEIINQYLEVRLTSRTITATPAQSHNVDALFRLPELKKLAIHDACYYIAKAGVDQDRFLMAHGSVKQYGQPDPLQVSEATGVDVFWIRRSQVDPHLHEAMILLQPDKDIERSRQQVKELCQRGSFRMAERDVPVTPFEAKETTITLMRAADNLAAEQYIQEALAALEKRLG